VKIFLLPIEPFVYRYTEQWYRWWAQDLRAEGWTVKVIDGEPVGEMEAGDFLDPVKTWVWKGTQVAALARCWSEVKDGDWILTLDGWGPSTTAACYMRDMTGLKIKVAAFFHAGSYAPLDMLDRVGMRRWALDVERGWMKGLDLILVGSEFSKKLIEDNVGQSGLPIVACGVPIHAGELIKRAPPMPFHQRGQVVVFPHRHSPDKHPEMFGELRWIYERLFPNDKVVWVQTIESCKTKQEYYETLACARVSVSFTFRETFGIAMQESQALGAWPVVPFDGSYPEVIRVGYKGYGNLVEAADLVHKCLRAEIGPEWDGHHELAVQRASEAMKE